MNEHTCLFSDTPSQAHPSLTDIVADLADKICALSREVTYLRKTVNDRLIAIEEQIKPHLDSSEAEQITTIHKRIDHLSSRLIKISADLDMRIYNIEEQIKPGLKVGCTDLPFFTNGDKQEEKPKTNGSYSCGF